MTVIPGNVSRLDVAAAAACFLFIAASAPPDRARAQAELAAFQPFVGEWKGTGQVRRGSSQGAWIEQASWAWKYEANNATLELTVAGGKHFASATLAADREPGHYTLTLVGVDRTTKVLRGQRDADGKLVLTAESKDEKKGADGLPDRASFRLVAGGDRLVLLLEQQAGANERYTPLAEIGYTRAGSGFGQGTAYRECVVTGGRGTIEVTYQGKTYYVCCTGCRDLFHDDPAGVLREYEAKKKKEQEQAAAKK